MASMHVPATNELHPQPSPHFPSKARSHVTYAGLKSGYSQDDLELLIPLSLPGARITGMQGCAQLHGPDHLL